MEHDTSDEDSLIPNKDIDEESWTFMENPVYDMNKEENNEPITSNIDDGDDYWDFCGYLIKNPIYAISSKGSAYLEICGSPIYYTSIERSMDMETSENLSMEVEHLEFSCDHSESYHAKPHKGISNRH